MITRRFSAAHRWINCPGSENLIRKLDIQETTSPHAEEGIKAHEDAARILQGKDPIHVTDPVEQQYLRQYADYVTLLLRDPAKLKIEQKVTLIKGLSGTLDAGVIDPPELDVFDLKWGKGVRVPVTENEQLLAYGCTYLETAELLHGEVFERVTLHIYQPRIQHYDSWCVTPQYMKQWKNEVLLPAFELSQKADAPLVPGAKQCQWCPAKGMGCPAVTAQNLELVSAEFDDLTLNVEPPAPETLPPARIGQILEHKKQIVNWLHSLETFVMDGLNAGTITEKEVGHKLVAGRSLRRWTDEDKAQAIAREKFRLMDVCTTKFKSPKAIEDLYKTEGVDMPEQLRELIVKPDGKPTLVSLDDKRQSLPQIVNEFDEVGE